MPKKNVKLTRRQRRFVKELARGQHASDAALHAGYSSKNPQQSAYQAMEALKKTVPELMNEIGLSEHVLLKKHLAPLLVAQRRKHFQHNGKILSTKPEAALEIRRDAVDMALRLHGSYAPLQLDTTHKTVSVIVLDVPRPAREVQPGATIEVAPSTPPAESNGHKKAKSRNGTG